MKIVEDVLSDDDRWGVVNYIVSSYMPWYFNDTTTERERDDIYQFTHTMIDSDEVNNLTEQFEKLLVDIFRRVGIKNPRVKRAKLNLLPRQPYTEKKLEGSIHQDYPSDSNLSSLIYYLHDSDGDTVIYKHNGTAVNITPKANTLVMFDSLLKHRATPPTVNQKRIVLNIVYYK